MKNKLWGILTELETVGVELDALTKLLGFLATSLNDEAAKVGDDPIRALGFITRVDTFCTMLYAVCTGFDTQIAALSERVDTCYNTVKAGDN